MVAAQDNEGFDADQPIAVITTGDFDMKYDLLQSDTHKRHVNIQRPVYTEEDIIRLYGQDVKTESLRKKVKRTFTDNCSCSQILQRLLSFFPIISWLPKYQRKYFIRDLSAGLTLGIMQIPQGMAYGMLTTLPPIYGLYASLIPVLVYFIMGSSRHVSIGTFAIICLMVGEVVEKKVNLKLPPTFNSTTTSDDTNREMIALRVQYAVTVSFLVGAMQFVFGFLRIGFITIFLSDPLISGFTTGAAFHVFSSQVKHLVGMSIPRKDSSGFFSLFKLYGYIFSHVKKTNIGALVIGIISAIILFVVKYLTQKYKKKIKFPIPAELIVVVLGTGLSYGFSFKETFNVPILEKVPKGLPPISIPVFSEMAEMIVDCASIAIISYAISVSVAKAFAKKNKYSIDANQELYAYGAANMIGSFLSCFVASASLSRSLIQENLGSTQVSSFLASILIVLTLTVLAPLFQYLPRAILAAIVLVALKGLFRQFTVFKSLLKISKIDSMIWIFSFICVILFGVDIGLAAGLVANLLAAIVRNSRPTSSLMGQVKKTEIYLNREGNLLIDIPGVIIFQFHAPLFFANVEYFQETLYERTVNPGGCFVMTVPPCYQRASIWESRQNLPPDNDSDNNFYIGDQTKRARTETVMLPLQKPRDLSSIQRSGSFDSPKTFTSRLVFSDPSRRPFCPLHTVILDCSQICYTDTMGVGALVSICSEYKVVGVSVYFANCPANLLDVLQAGGFIANHGAENMFVTIHDAVQYTLSKEHLKGICDPTLKNINNDASYEYVVCDDNSLSAQSCQEETESADLSESQSKSGQDQPKV